MGLVIELPKEKTKAIALEPQKLMIVSLPKTGKTSLCSALPSNLIIDLEGGTKSYDTMGFNIKDLAIKNSMSEYEVIGSIVKSLKDDIVKNGKPKYDFITIDTTTVLEDIANQLAITRYKQTPMGKSWSGTLITNLPNGAGEGHLREAFTDLYKSFDGLYNKCLILVAHSKKASINKNGEQLDARDIDLRGKNKSITTSEMDATGFMRRDKDGNKNYLSFKTSETGPL